MISNSSLERKKSITKDKKHVRGLENKIVELTQSLSEKIVEINDTRKANLNLLEDIEGERERLIKINLKEEVLIKDLEKFKLAVDNIYDNIIITDPEATVIYVNKAVEKITGYKFEEVVGKKSGALWKKPMPLEYYQKLWETIKEQKKVFIGEIQNRRKNGEIYTATISISPILDKNGAIEFFVGIERDITKEKELDHAKSEFISIASHQLRTPLTGIQWVVERFTKKENLTPKGREYLNDIHTSAKRLTELVDLMLNLSRIEAGKIGITPELIDVVGIVKSYLGEVAGICEKKELTVVFTDHPAEFMVKSDKSSLRNIVQNVISNAIEYTSNKGRVEIVIQKKENTFLIKVMDTGIGIPKLEQPHIFEKFVRADNAKLYRTDGTGIGLYIAKRAVGLLGGNIWFESEENKGSIFYIELPLEFKSNKNNT